MVSRRHRNLNETRVPEPVFSVRNLPMRSSIKGALFFRDQAERLVFPQAKRPNFLLKLKGGSEVFQRRSADGGPMQGAQA